jgi:hypothetical protein
VGSRLRVGDGPKSKAATTRGDLDRAHRLAARTLAHPFYEQLNRLLEERGFDEWVERQCTRFYAERMGQAESGAGAVLPYAVHRVFRRHRRRAWDRMAADSLALRSFLGVGMNEMPPITQRSLALDG